MPDRPPYLTLFQAVWWIAFREIPPDIRSAPPNPDEGTLDADVGPVAPLAAISEAFEKAENELIHHLQTGTLVACGRGVEGVRREIPAYFWQDAILDHIDSAADNPGHLAAEAVSPGLRDAFAGDRRWYDITVPTTALIKAWGPGKAAAKAKYAQAAVIACEQALADLMRAGSPTKPKREYRKEYMAKLKISGEAFDRAWTAAWRRVGNTNWSRPGRRPKEGSEA